MATTCKAILDLKQYPIMPGRHYRGPKGNIPGRPGGDISTMVGANFTLTNFVTREELPACQKLGIQAIVVEGYDDWHLTRSPEKYLSDEEIDRRVAQLVEDCRPYRDIVLAYYIFDEPSAHHFPYLRKVRDIMRKHDPEKACFINLYPYAATKKQLGTETYEEYLEKFIEIVQPDDFIRYDDFSVMYMQKDVVAGRGDNRQMQRYLYNLMAVRNIAQKNNLHAWNAACACQIRPWANCPTMGNLALQAFTTLAAGFKGLAWYSYYTENQLPNGYYGYSYAPINCFNQETTLTWHYLKEINREVLVYGNLLLHMDSTKVFFRNTQDYNCELLNNNAQGDVVLDVYSEAQSPLMVGEFKDKEGKRWFMVVNLDHRETLKAEISLQEGYKALYCSLSTGSLLPTNLEFPVLLPPGTGYLYKAVKV